MIEIDRYFRLKKKKIVGHLKKDIKMWRRAMKRDTVIKVFYWWPFHWISFLNDALRIRCIFEEISWNLRRLTSILWWRSEEEIKWTRKPFHTTIFHFLYQNIDFSPLFIRFKRGKNKAFFWSKTSRSDKLTSFLLFGI